MSYKRVQKAAAAVLTVLALAAPASSQAAIVLGSGMTPAGVPNVSDELASATVALSIEAARVDLEGARSVFALADGPHRRVYEVLRGASDVALWNLVATVQAQQKAKTFDLVNTSAKTVWEIEKNQVSPVPLPGVVWLFVMAVIGLVGTRMRGAPGARADTVPMPA
ncbi:hypothetical protein [Piscinibacter sp. HJYY11]|uniref:hypothetical protein n=1 Tax=Piscinibacter sp. HJYY11 TaxID=2801333 RepID=UPI00191D401F|nr:hypothetical protein [Piscinibacter sp. HJYY11]MBL0726178.1 hypothetical protein [Piscinibacter sp. HJYY11]